MRRRSDSETVEINEPDAVVKRLGQLHIPPDALLEAVRRGHLASSFVTKAHPVWFAGSVTNGETTGALRIALGGVGWSNNDDDNIARIISPEGDVIVCVVSGNSRTGLNGDGGEVQPRRKRGLAGIRLVTRNSQIAFLELLPDDDREKVYASLDAWGPTWFLLYYRDGDIVRSELSLARAISREGDLLEWSERLILTEIDMLEPVPRWKTDTTVEMTDIDVPVERRANAS